MYKIQTTESWVSFINHWYYTAHYSDYYSKVKSPSEGFYRIIYQILLQNSCEVNSKSISDMIRDWSQKLSNIRRICWTLNHQLLKLMFKHFLPRTIILELSWRELTSVSPRFFQEENNLFGFQNTDTKSNILMELARSAKDDALRELLVNRSTYRFVTHMDQDLTSHSQDMSL